MTSIYQSLIIMCFNSLIPNPYTIKILPDNQQRYILEAVKKECETRYKNERLSVCAEQKINCEEN